MKLPLRARITAWYFAVLVVAFASFAWISDLGFQHSIETTVNDASGANLESIQRVLARTAPKGDAKVKEELNELGGVSLCSKSQTRMGRSYFNLSRSRNRSEPFRPSRR